MGRTSREWGWPGIRAPPGPAARARVASAVVVGRRRDHGVAVLVVVDPAARRRAVLRRGMGRVGIAAAAVAIVGVAVRAAAAALGDLVADHRAAEAADHRAAATLGNRVAKQGAADAAQDGARLLAPLARGAGVGRACD